MSNEFQQRIESLRREMDRIQPDAAWVRRTRETLLMQVGNSLPVESATLMQHVQQFFSHFAPKQFWAFIRGPVAAVASVLVVALGGSVASVSAAGHSLPGDFFYSLKLATEQAQLALTSGNEDKLKLKIEFTGRRVEEIKAVMKKTDTTKREKSQRVVQATEILKRDLNTVKQQLDDVKADAVTPKTVEMAKLVDQKTQELVQNLQETKTAAPADAKMNMTDAQAAAADTGVKAIEVLAETHQAEGDSVPTQDVVQAIQDHAKTVAEVTGSFASSTDAANVASSAVAAGSTSTIPIGKAVEDIKVATVHAFEVQRSVEQASSTAMEKAIEDASNATSTSSDDLSPTSSSGTGLVVPTSGASSTNTEKSP